MSSFLKVLVQSDPALTNQEPVLARGLLMFQARITIIFPPSRFRNYFNVTTA